MKKVKGSYTLEAAFMMLIILFTILAVIRAGIFLYNRTQKELKAVVEDTENPVMMLRNQKNLKGLLEDE